MKRRLSAGLAVLALAFALAGGAAARAADHEGVWSGTWDGTGSGGRFVLTLETNKAGELGGNVSVTGEPTYKATLKTVSFSGSKMSATYDFPPDDRAEVALTGTFDGPIAKGRWVVRGKDGSGEVASGGWVVRKK